MDYVNWPVKEQLPHDQNFNGMVCLNKQRSHCWMAGAKYSRCGCRGILTPTAVCTIRVLWELDILIGHHLLLICITSICQLGNLFIFIINCGFLLAWPITETIISYFQEWKMKTKLLHLNWSFLVILTNLIDPFCLNTVLEVDLPLTFKI